MALLLISASVTFAQEMKLAEANLKDYSSEKHNKEEESSLSTYVIERDMQGAGDLTAEQLKGISQLSNSVLEEQGPEILWLHSYVTDDKIYCVYKGVDKKILREHAEKADFPITSIKKLVNVIGPETATASVN